MKKGFHYFYRILPDYFLKFLFKKVVNISCKFLFFACNVKLKIFSRPLFQPYIFVTFQ